MRLIFLDHQSSTPVLPEVTEAMKPFLVDRYGNPSSLHQQGLRARDALNLARTQLAALVHAESADHIIFTSSGTEAANLAVKGVAWANQRRGKHLVVSSIEHPAVLNSAAFLEAQGFRCTRVKVDRHGMVDPAEVEAALCSDTVLICVQHVNYDVGTIQPVRRIGEIATDRGIPLFVDACASAGWLPAHVQEMGASLVSIAPHRFYGPKGVGALYCSRQVRLASLIHGGDQEHGRRAGTENVPAIAGAGVAADLALRQLPERYAHVTALQKALWHHLKSGVTGLVLHGPEPGPTRLGTNLNVSAEGTEGEGVMLSLDMAGIAVGSGTACVSKSMKPSPVLDAMGVDRTLAKASVIFSLGKDNTLEEIEQAAAAFARTVGKLRQMSSDWGEPPARPGKVGAAQDS